MKASAREVSSRSSSRRTAVEKRGARRRSSSARTRDVQGNCTIVGRDHPTYAVGPYRVCLTDNQRATLFDDDLRRPIGCGVFACAYEAPDPRRIVKITRDAADVAALLRAQAVDVVPRVHRAFELRQGGRTIRGKNLIRVFAVEVDRVNMLQKTPDVVNQFQAIVDVVDTHRELPPVPAATREAVQRLDACDAACEDLIRDTFSAVHRLRSVGIDWTDIHEGNVGYDDRGQLKVVDLGVTRVALRDEDAQVLAGRMASAAEALGEILKTRTRRGRLSRRR